MISMLFRRLNTKVVVLAFVGLWFTFNGFFTPEAIAHFKAQSYLYFQIGENTITARAEVPVPELNTVLDLGFEDEDPRVELADLESHIEQIKAYVNETLAIECAPQSCEPIFQNYALGNTPVAQFVLLNYSVEGFDERPDELQVTYDAILSNIPGHTNMVLIEENWETGTFSNEASPLHVYNQAGLSQAVDLTSGNLLRGSLAIAKLGVKHILKGIDHVLFLIALLLLSVVRREDGRWQPVNNFSTAFIRVVKIATAFTIAHSITLGLAALQVFSLPSRLVESIIAVSIGITVVEIFYPIFKNRVWLIIFIFGLFHGFGFAGVLGDLGVTNRYTLLSLFSFNAGVEVGQLVIITIFFPVLYLIRKHRLYPSFILRGGGVVLGVMSALWFIERAFNVTLPVGSFFRGVLGIVGFG